MRLENQHCEAESKRVRDDIATLAAEFGKQFGLSKEYEVMQRRREAEYQAELNRLNTVRLAEEQEAERRNTEL